MLQRDDIRISRSQRICRLSCNYKCNSISSKFYSTLFYVINNFLPIAAVHLSIGLRRCISRSFNMFQLFHLQRKRRIQIRKQHNFSIFLKFISTWNILSQYSSFFNFWRNVQMVWCLIQRTMSVTSLTMCPNARSNKQSKRRKLLQQKSRNDLTLFSWLLICSLTLNGTNIYMCCFNYVSKCQMALNKFSWKITDNTTSTQSITIVVPLRNFIP